ncbi:putative nucleotide sugar epimerase dehydratase protein [Stappia aggregata IAM 12614]|uniref:Putative nucleotide sugar epimerase dehydratase protein n=1 Tax=Roseibium aggregatum (strain ATCC 25650 / DSM 13394 / JCM 20685 / NBRC 16684 / NCIMB 2208 / IAM 12614 / B1) TaxID=384765 RepID=A0NNV5_ROSAI|nr:putative nucleotide sugar epimerase dehydratase protein [Stappia aggregata IAM 12614] [Roseibium aggregatum IAM 12614]
MADFYSSETLSKIRIKASSHSFLPTLPGVHRWWQQLVTELKANRRLVLGDVVSITLSAALAVLLTVTGSAQKQLLPAILPFAALACVCGLVIFPLAGFYRRDTRSTSLRDIVVLLKGALLASVSIAILSRLNQVTSSVPIPVVVVQFYLAVPALGALRVIARGRELTRQSRQLKEGNTKIPVLLVGTGASCDLFLRSLRNTGSRYQPVGIIDDARNAQGLYFHDVQIIGSLRDPENVLERLSQWNVLPQRLLLTEPITHFDSEGIQKLTVWASGHGVTVSRLNGLEDLGAQDLGDGQNMRTVDPDDILDRPQKAVERSLLFEVFRGRRILVTGAGGSIGSELTRQIASFNPAEIVIIDNCEFNAYSIDMDLSQHFPNVPRRMYVASIVDADRVNSIFRQHRPELVFNAAALKHVPIVELNPCEGVLTNVVGSRNVADAAREVGALAMVQISTDKAVNTTNVMGATKRVAEFYVQAQDRITNETEERTRFFSVRFGNVLGSSGSLIPLFQRQITNGGPITITDPKMERYFMTIREAVQLTLVSAASGLKFDTSQGEIFVLDMGSPVKIVDLAERMIRLAGLTPHKDIKINFIGMRPGEKLFEELFDKSESRADCGIPGVSAARPEGVPIARLRAMILKLELAARRQNGPLVNQLLRDLVPGYGTKSSYTVETAKAAAGSIARVGAMDLPMKLPVPASAVLRPASAPEVLSAG